MTHTVTCFGETLWDVLPTSRQPGGAPMNVAVDLRNFGIAAQLITRVGSDELGSELFRFIEQSGLPPDLIQTGQMHLTGVAKANISDSNEVTYKIVQPVAWDYIHLEPHLIDVVQNSDVFVYGSLAARSPMTRETLLTLLDVARQKVFDMNLRAPHYDRETVEHLLRRADVAKLNEHELAELVAWNETDVSASLRDTMQCIRDRYDLQTLCVTLGSNGAALLDAAGFVQQGGFPVRVSDTIGSGDAFLAAFLYKTLQGVPAWQALEFACATGAYVAMQPGATPPFTEAAIVDTLLQTTSNTPHTSFSFN